MFLNFISPVFALASISFALPTRRSSTINDDPNDPSSPIYKNPNFNKPDANEGILLSESFTVGFLSTLLLFLIIGIIVLVIRVSKSKLSELELSREEDNQAYMEFNQEEQELYFQSKEYLNDNPYLRGVLTLSQNLLIQEKGIKAWEFTKDLMLTNNDLMILNKYELNFFKKFECSSQTNLPIPMKNEVYYFESKIYSLPDPENTLISIGLGIKPYPWFRLPGRHAHSVSYDSDGYRRHNQPFKFDNDPPFPKLIEGDVVGVGYRVRTGTIFFTRNGKKVSELKIGGHIKNFKLINQGQLFPIIGANNLCSIHVNLGQLGYVFIEGNVKKWGFAPLEGTGPAPPAYNKFNADILLERSEIDDDDILDRENDFPPNFWDIRGFEDDREEQNNSDDGLTQDKYSYNAYSEVNSTDERITLNSLDIPFKPPSYNEGDEEEQPSGPGRDLEAQAGPNSAVGTEMSGSSDIPAESDITVDLDAEAENGIQQTEAENEIRENSDIQAENEIQETSDIHTETDSKTTQD